MDMRYTKDLGGLFFVIRSSYASAGCKSTGLGVKGFNKATGRYEWFYAKTTGSGMSLFTGVYDEDTRTFTYAGDVPSEMGPLPTRIEEHIIDDKTYQLDLYQDYAGELSHKVTVTFRRA